MSRSCETYIDRMREFGFPLDFDANPTAIARLTEAFQLSPNTTNGVVILPREYDSQWVIDYPRDAELLILGQLRPRTDLLLPPSDPELARDFWQNPASLIRFTAATPENQRLYAGIYQSMDVDSIEAHLKNVCRQLSQPFENSPWLYTFRKARKTLNR